MSTNSLLPAAPVITAAFSSTFIWPAGAGASRALARFHNLVSSAPSIRARSTLATCASNSASLPFGAVLRIGTQLELHRHATHSVGRASFENIDDDGPLWF